MTNWGQMKISNVLSCGFWQLQIYFPNSLFWWSAGGVCTMYTGEQWIEYWMDNWTVSDVNGHAGVIGQYLANAIISDKSK